MKKIMSMILAVMLVFMVSFVFTGSSYSPNYFIFHAMGCDLTNYEFVNDSKTYQGAEAIFGKHTMNANNPDQKKVLDSLSKGYFVGQSEGDNNILTFNIFAKYEAKDCKLTIRMGAGWGTVPLKPEYYTIKVNGTALIYDEIAVIGSLEPGFVTSFRDVPISQKFDLNEGNNIITISLRKLFTGDLVLGIDYIKITTPYKTNGSGCKKEFKPVELSWTSKWEQNKKLIGIEE